MKNKKYIIVGIVSILIFALIIIFIKFNKNNKNENEVENNVEIEISEKNEIDHIESIKKELNSTADTDIYKIEEEPGGRKILQVKEEVQFKVDLAGIIKNGKPEENEIDKLVEKKPQKSGVWISKQSRENFLQLLKHNNIEDFEIDNDGFLKSKTKNTETSLEKGLQDMIESKKHFIINITGVSYERDYISGEIVEYPFEDMDPAQIIEPYILNDYVILEVTSNKNKKLSDLDILESIVEYNQ